MNKEYDLKNEMKNDITVMECIKDIIDKTNCNLNINDIFNDNEDDSTYIIRYLLFRIQGQLGCGFDCDKTEIVKNLYQKYFDYGEFNSTDTLYSMQYMWGNVLRRLWLDDRKQVIFEEYSDQYNYFKEKYGSYIDPNTSENIVRIDKAQKFIYELIHLEEIKKSLGEDLYLKFAELAHWYHTIGNMAPCPNGSYNTSKGLEKYCYDRLDLFMKTETFKNNPEWVEWFKNNTEKYFLESIVKNNLGPVPIIDKEENFTPFKKEEIINYIEDVIKIISSRFDKIQLKILEEDHKKSI